MRRPHWTGPWRLLTVGAIRVWQRRYALYCAGDWVDCGEMLRRLP